MPVREEGTKNGWNQGWRARAAKGEATRPRAANKVKLQEGRERPVWRLQARGYRPPHGREHLEALWQRTGSDREEKTSLKCVCLRARRNVHGVGKMDDPGK